MWEMISSSAPTLINHNIDTTEVKVDYNGMV